MDDDYSLYKHFAGLDLNARQEEFVVQYCGDFTYNATRAYLHVYDTEGEATAGVNACKLLRNARIRAAVNIEINRKLADTDALAQKIIDEHARIAFAHSILAAEGWNPLGVLVKDITELPDEVSSAIASIEPTANGLRVKFYDKQKSLDSLARILGMFDDTARNVGEKYEHLMVRLAREEEEKNNGTT